MQIKRLQIDDYLCLVDFDIVFDTVSGGSSTILIGENGAGKSTIFPISAVKKLKVNKNRTTTSTEKLDFIPNKMTIRPHVNANTLRLLQSA